MVASTSATEFDFDEGDRVLVRYREHGTSGNIVAKFEADVDGFINEDNSLLSTIAVLRLPWGECVRLRATQAEFEVLEDE